MTDPKPLTLKQWQRRALVAEALLSQLHELRRFEASMEIKLARENGAMRVALREIQETTNWAYGAIADRLGGAQ